MSCPCSCNTAADADGPHSRLVSLPPKPPPRLITCPCLCPAARRASGLQVRAYRDDVKETVKEARAEVVDQLSASSADIVDKVSAFWEESEEKPTIVAVGVGSILAIYFASTIVDAVDRLPVVSASPRELSRAKRTARHPLTSSRKPRCCRSPPALS